MRLSYHETCEGVRLFELRIEDHEFVRANLSPTDRWVLHDIEHGPDRGTPIADKLLGLELLARRIEETTNDKRKEEA